MSHIAKRLVSAAASAFVLTVTSKAAQAQTDVLTFTGTKTANTNANSEVVYKVMTGVYTFNTSMILNSIGFYDTDNNFGGGYTINGVPSYPSTGFAPRDSNNIFWLTLNRQMNAGDVLYVTTADTEYLGATANSGTNVSYGGMGFGNPPSDLITSRANSNIRVTNPGSSVAPEPGSIALLLTGGGVLAGIALRRRRNAA